MGVNNKLYDKNHLDYAKSIHPKTLYISGALVPAILYEDYEGRLQIHNNVGACQAEVVEVTSGELPDNYSVYVDNISNEVVLAWPGTETIDNTLINPDLETGDLSNWSIQSVGGDLNLEVNSTHPHSGLYSAYWAGGKGLGSEGGIECYAENDTKGIITPKQRVSAGVWVLYNPDGGTPKGSRGQARLNWYDESDNLIGTSYGFLVKTRKYNGKWTLSTVEDRAPVGAKYVKLLSWITATGEGHTYFDDASWDIPNATGAVIKEPIELTIKVTDTIGRVAYWSGAILVAELTTLDPTTLYAGGTGGTISTDNLTLTKTSDANGWTVGARAPASALQTSGKFYIECTTIVPPTRAEDRGAYFGLLNSNSLSAQVSGGSSTFYIQSDTTGFVNGGTLFTGPRFSVAGQTVGIAVDIDTGKVWWRNSSGWNPGGDPESGVGQIATISAANLSGGLVPYAVTYSTNGKCRVNFGQEPFELGEVPAGFFGGWSK
jgi:hypothetical protein